MSFIAMLPVSGSPFSAWSDRCLTFFSLVRHVSQLGKTHVSPFSIPDSNTDFEFATGRTLQPVHLVCIPSRISLFCIDPDDFQRDRLERVANLLLVGQVKPMFGAIPILSGSNLSDFPVHFLELGNTHLHCDTAV